MHNILRNSFKVILKHLFKYRLEIFKKLLVAIMELFKLLSSPWKQNGAGQSTDATFKIPKCGLKRENNQINIYLCIIKLD